MKVKDIPELHREALEAAADLDLPADIGELEVAEFFAWWDAKGQDLKAEIDEGKRQLAIANEIHELAKSVWDRHPNVPLGKVASFLPPQQASRLLGLLDEMPEYIRIRGAAK